MYYFLLYVPSFIIHIFPLLLKRAHIINFFLIAFVFLIIIFLIDIYIKKRRHRLLYSSYFAINLFYFFACQSLLFLMAKYVGKNNGRHLFLLVIRDSPPALFGSKDRRLESRPARGKVRHDGPPWTQGMKVVDEIGGPKSDLPTYRRKSSS